MEMGRHNPGRRGDCANLITGCQPISHHAPWQNMGMDGDNVPVGTTLISDKDGFSQKIIADGNDIT